MADVQKQTIHRFLTENGDGTGTHNAIGDYSITPLTLFIQPPPRVVYQLTRFFISLEGTGFRWERYGGIIGGVTNGLELKVLNDDGVLNDLTDAVVAHTCGDWSLHCFDAEIREDPGGGDLFQMRWNFDGAGQHITLHGDTADRLSITFNDNFSSLVHQYYKVEGWVE